ncbi:hypothetical protein JJB07_17015 [Tumebacillus sp. ITR2]|uniref:DUF1653 domain-containing protein n=1 Tax=Tumebacillus amylolyticus TaxID=2801339 RepID=A0ABS1JDI5_9BACL|nr:hypothetical protein [Tumebacillus amylolyticus]MBL0388308.1 hypothetical protein [Tumebacillus amylolyticus]
MARLEYRLFDESKSFPVAYFYERIGKPEIATRMACDYFIKEGKIYEKTSTAIDAGVYVIYVQPAEDEKIVDPTQKPDWKTIRIELREYKEDTDYYPVIHTYEFRDDMEALLHMQSNFLYLYGKEWEKTSAEIDEDRKVYVWYATSKQVGG